MTEARLCPAHKGAGRKRAEADVEIGCIRKVLRRYLPRSIEHVHLFLTTELSAAAVLGMRLTLLSTSAHHGKYEEKYESKVTGKKLRSDGIM